MSNEWQTGLIIIVVALIIMSLFFRFDKGRSFLDRIFRVVVGLGGIVAIVLGIIFIVDDSTSDIGDRDNVRYEQRGGDVSFKRSPTYYTLKDKDRLCVGKKGYFVVTKTNKIINSADECDNCGHLWYVHKKR